MSPSLSSPAPKEDPPLTPAYAVGFLPSRGWDATLVKAADSPTPRVALHPPCLPKFAPCPSSAIRSSPLSTSPASVRLHLLVLRLHRRSHVSL